MIIKHQMYALQSNTSSGTAPCSVTAAATDAAGTSVTSAQQVLVQPHPHNQSVATDSGIASQAQQLRQQHQQVTINLQPGVLPQQIQQQHVQLPQRPLTWPHGQPAATTVPLCCDSFAQQQPVSMPIAIPAATSVPQQLSRAQPAAISPNSLQSSQQSPLANHNSRTSSANLTSRAGSLRPDALGQLQQPADGPSRAVAANVQNSFKQREAAIAATVATAGIDITGSTAPISLLGAVSNSQRFSGKLMTTFGRCWAAMGACRLNI